MYWKKVSSYLTHTRMGLTALTEQNLFVQSVRQAPVSSSSAKLYFLKNERDGRPQGRAGIATGLYHEAFAIFRASLNDTSIDISSEYLSLVDQFMDTSIQVYTNEKARFEALKPLLDGLLESEFVSLGVTDAKADGTIITNAPNGHVAFRGLWELKNEIGTGASDPVTQVSYSYRKYWGAKEVSKPQLVNLYPYPLNL
jgi:hypothetical protein